MQSGSQPTTLSVALLSHSVEGFPTEDGRDRKALHFVVKAEWERRRVAAAAVDRPHCRIGKEGGREREGARLMQQAGSKSHMPVNAGHKIPMGG